MPTTSFLEHAGADETDTSSPESPETHEPTSFTPRALPLDFLAFLDGMVADLIAANGGWGGFAFDLHHGVPSLAAQHRTYKPRDWAAA